MRRKFSQYGFSALEVGLIVIAMGLIGGTGTYIYKANQSASDTLTAANGSANTKVETLQEQADENSNELNYSRGDGFYECYIKVATTSVSDYRYGDATCHMPGTTEVYDFPKMYTDDLIRSLDGGRVTTKLTKLEVAELQRLGQEGYKACGLPDVFTLRLIAKITDKFMHTGYSCDSGHRELQYYDGSAWSTIYKGQDVIDCETVERYKVPPSLFKTESESTPECYDAAKDERRTF